LLIFTKSIIWGGIKYKMNYRVLGKTGLKVSEIGLGAEWLERHNAEDVKAVIERSEAYGINIIDCWMSEPNVRSNIGAAIAGHRDKWVIQGHIGSTWQNGQYVRTRDMEKVKEAFEDLLNRLQTDYIDLGMIHFVDEAAEFHKIMVGDFIEYIHKLKKVGTIRHIGLSTHNPEVAKLAALSGEIEMVLFSLNPAFDMLPASEDINLLFSDHYNENLKGIAPEREELYQICERENVGITVMKGYAGGRLFSAENSPFGVALTPVQCLHYALTRPAVASVMVGCSTPDEVDAAVDYETATEDRKDYATVLANAPYHAYSGQCTYCGHCAPCPSYIDIAMVNKLYDLAVMQDEIPATVRAHYNGLTSNASDCISCGACEERCPFDVAVIERMKKADQLFV
jgi:predicted aldo/keto reductase-like oxidoreductase